MTKFKKTIFFLSIFLLVSYPFLFAEETLTITTYYPSPYGSYNELTTTGKTCLATTSGNVGIGTTTPGDILHIAPIPWAPNQSGGIRLSTTDGTHFIYGIKLKSDASGNSRLSIDAPLLSEAVTIKNDGNVGIGTTNPGEKLYVLGQAGAQSTFGGNGAAAVLASNTGPAVIATSISGDIFRGYQDASQVFVIKNSGNVGIGITPTHLIHLNGGAYCDGTGDWITGSDRAYKKDIDYDFKYGLKEVEQLKPVYYVHKEDKNNRTQVGFIAQDVLKVIPELVSGDEGALGLSYGQLTAVLVKAVQEQQKQIDGLKEQIQQLTESLLPIGSEKKGKFLK